MDEWEILQSAAVFPVFGLNLQENGLED